MADIRHASRKSTQYLGTRPSRVKPLLLPDLLPAVECKEVHELKRLMNRLSDLVQDEVRENHCEFLHRLCVVNPQALAHALEFGLVLHLQRRLALADRFQGIRQVPALIGVCGGPDDGKLKQVARDDQISVRAAHAERGLCGDAAGAVGTQLAAQPFFTMAALRLLGFESLEYRTHALRQRRHVNFMALQVLMAACHRLWPSFHCFSLFSDRRDKKAYPPHIRDASIRTKQTVRCSCTD